MTKFASPDRDELEKARKEQSSKYIQMSDLVVGRHVLIVPKELREVEGTNGPFESVTSDVIVLDGIETDKITEFPFIQLDMWVSGFNVVTQLKKYIGTGQPVFGLLINQKGYQFEKGSPKVRDSQATEDAYSKYLIEVGGSPVGSSEEPPF